MRTMEMLGLAYGRNVTVLYRQVTLEEQALVEQHLAQRTPWGG